MVFMSVKKKILLILFFILGNFNIYFSYSLSVQQGKFFLDHSVERIKPGMNKEKIEYILGSPDVIDPFFKHQWNYIFQYYHEGNLTQKSLILLFFDDRLVKISGNYIYSFMPNK
jgi:outer membrane protein assembly factor BamE